MKITKLIHSCLLVEMPAPINRTAMFDPGIFSIEAVDVDRLIYLDDIIITHNHFDHMHIPLIKKLVAKFPEVRITAPAEAVTQLAAQGIKAQSEPTPGIEFFDSPHHDLSPVGEAPQQLGVHYLDTLTNPGDSHEAKQTKQILALPITAPWGSQLDAVKLALKLKPRYIIPIHDWHWNDDARQQAYDTLENFFGQHNIEFIKPETGKPFVLKL